MPICIHEAPVIWDVALVKQQFERNLCAAHGSDGEIYLSLSRETNVLFVCCWTEKSLAGPRVCHLPGMVRGKLFSLMIIYWISTPKDEALWSFVVVWSGLCPLKMGRVEPWPENG